MDRVYLIFLTLIFSCTSLSVIADELTPERYVLADLESREVTINGMEARLSILQQGAEIDEQSVLDDINRTAVEAVFARYGTTGTSHAIYGTRQQEAIGAFLEARPDLQEQYNELEARFNELLLEFRE